MQKIPIPFRRRLDIFRRQALPLLVWLGAVAGVVMLLDLDQGRAQYFGLVAAQEHVVSAPSDGRLRDLRVSLYQEVQAGELLATMDDAALAAELDTAAAEGKRLAAEQQAILAELQADASAAAVSWDKDARRFTMDAVGLRVDLLQAQINLSEDRLEVERLRVAETRAQDLLAARAGTEAEAEDLALRRQAIEARIASTEALVQTLEGQIQAAEDRAATFAAAPLAVDLQPRFEALEQGMAVQQRRLHEIEVARAALSLRAPVSGVVSRLDATAGRSLTLGQGILAITPFDGAAVVFYQPQERPAAVQAGESVRLARLGDLASADAVVTAVAPEIVRLPESLWRDPARPEYGRATRLSPTPALGLAVGEPVQVFLQR